MQPFVEQNERTLTTHMNHPLFILAHFFLVCGYSIIQAVQISYLQPLVYLHNEITRVKTAILVLSDHKERAAERALVI